jgi:hypothetical protein
MKDALFNLLLVIAVEAVSAVVAYLKDRLVSNLRRDSHDAWSDNHAEFA